MAGRQSSAVEKALEAFRAGGLSVSECARQHEVALSTMRRALRRAGVAPLEAPKGPAHRSYIDGRTAAKRVNASRP